VQFGQVWTAESAALVNRLRARPLGAPLVLLSAAHRVSLGIGSSAATRVKDTTATLDLTVGDAHAAAVSGALAGGNAAAAAAAAAGGAAAAPSGSTGTSVLSFEFSRAELAGFLERLDALQAQIDSLS
jgi:hypothetical protein